MGRRVKKEEQDNRWGEFYNEDTALKERDQYFITNTIPIFTFRVMY